jgi:hypothetical protein
MNDLEKYNDELSQIYDSVTAEEKKFTNSKKRANI